MNDNKTKQQIVDKIQSSTNILITVSDSPSVDALSAAIGLTASLNKAGKHATAIFSGSIPPAINFLEPNKTFEDSTDSLRDFIIALNKEKADHLRYKIDGDMVKVFITPYRTTISEKDLEFSQGDYNVELVIALGVTDQAHLDKAIESHGQILHDATVITMESGEMTSNLGGIDWHDPQASSLSEMVVGLIDTIKLEGGASILDQQNSTAFLTGIVAETNRFSNSKTSSKAMNVAAQLMGAGADQQLVATKVQAQPSEPEIPAEQPEQNAYSADSVGVSIDHSAKEPEQAEPEPQPTEQPAKPVEPQEPEPKPSPNPNDTKPASAYAVDDNQLATSSQPPESSDSTNSSAAGAYALDNESLTAESSHKLLNDEETNNKTLEHHYLTDQPENAAPINSTDKSSQETENIDIFSNKSPVKPDAPGGSAIQQNQAVPAPPPPISPDQAASLPQPPPLPDFSKLPEPHSLSDLGGVSNPSPVSSVPPPPDKLGDILDGKEQNQAPASDPGEELAKSFPVSPMVRPSGPGDSLTGPANQPVATPPSAAPQPESADPAQFKIPGQTQ